MADSVRAKLRTKFKHLCVPTPIVEVQIEDNMTIFVKDESYRGLPVVQNGSFKLLGGAAASLSNPNAKRLACASDGNHAIGVAHAAIQLGIRADVFLPAGICASRVTELKDMGANVIETNMSYDDTVTKAAAYAKNSDDVYLIQDTESDGNTSLGAIKEAYGLIIDEVLRSDIDFTHVVFQVGVGSFASACVDYWINHRDFPRPLFITVEPEECASLFESMQEQTLVDIAHQTKNSVSQGLNCANISPSAWATLRKHVHASIVTNDVATACAMCKYKSGLSGAAVAIGALQNLSKEQRSTLRMNKSSKILIFNTEGRKIDALAMTSRL